MDEAHPRICVTGAAGRLGRHVVHALEQTYALTLLDRLPPEGDDRFRKIDLLDRSQIQNALKGADVVVHLAAIDGSVDAPDEAVFSTNVLSTWNLFDAAVKCGVKRIVHCSSNSVVGLNRPGPALAPLYLPVDESHPCRPSSAYGLSKFLSEEVARSFVREHRIDVLCLRPTYILFPEIRAAILAEQAGAPGGEPPESFSDPVPRRKEQLPQLGSYVWPEDVARAVDLALKAKWSGFTPLFISAADTFLPQPTLVAVEELYGAVPKIRDATTFDADPYASAYAITAASKLLGWRPGAAWSERGRRVAATAARR